MFLARTPQIIALAARSRLPTMYGATEMVRAGGLMGYGVNVVYMYRRGASFVDRILKGARPADLPVEQPDDLRAGAQPQDGKSARFDDPAVDPGARRRGHPVA